MIRAQSVKRLLEELVINAIKWQIESLGFKYIKTKKSFKRINSKFEQNIYLNTDYTPLEYDEENDILYLRFNLSKSIRCPKFDKWVIKTIEQSSSFNHGFDPVHCKVEIDASLLSGDDFYTPTKSQEFKKLVSESLIGVDEKPRQSLKQLVSNLEELSESLDYYSSTKVLFDNRPKWFRDYLRLLVFDGFNDQAKEHYLKHCEELKQRAKEQLSENHEDAKKSIQYFEHFIIETKVLLGIEVANPFVREIKILPSANRKVKLGENLGYMELFSLDTSLVSIQSHAVNDDGVVIAIVDNGKIMKFDGSGEISTIGVIVYPTCFRNNIQEFYVKWIEEAKCFICNNYIINQSYELVELRIDIDAEKFKPNTLFPILNDIKYSEEENRFYTLFGILRKKSILSIYEANGILVSSKTIDGNCIKVNIKRKELVKASENNSYDIFDFHQNLKGNYKYGNGNWHITFSNKGDIMICHSYSTKSQVYDLAKNKKKTLWAHPTYIKGYKEKFYNDINHNFGLNRCEFSPDDKYIVGGADHGKYVFWEAKNYKRIELIPTIESLIIFNYSRTEYYGDGKIAKVHFRPYTADLENSKFFVNRGYWIRAISFLENGNYFITQVEDSLLSWNSTGEAIGHVFGIGRCAFSKEKYMASFKDNQLVVFKRAEKLDSNFKNSKFKEIEENEFNSNIHNLNLPEQ